MLTYRSEFDAVVKQEGIDGLIKRLTQKNVPPAGGRRQRAEEVRVLKKAAGLMA